MLTCHPSLLFGRHLAEERAFGQETALSTVANRSTAAEQRCHVAEALVRRMRSAAAEAETTAASVARASAVEGERTKKLVKAKHLGFPKVNFGWKLREVFKPMFFV
jgi:hypothetical protein